MDKNGATKSETHRQKHVFHDTTIATQDSFASIVQIEPADLSEPAEWKGRAISGISSFLHGISAQYQ